MELILSDIFSVYTLFTEDGKKKYFLPIEPNNKTKIPFTNRTFYNFFFINLDPKLTQIVEIFCIHGQILYWK